MKAEHILVIRFSALGDVAMAVPVVYSLAHQYPHVRITVLSRPIAKAFFQDLAPNVSFMEADIQGEYRGVKGLNALYRRLTAKHFTAVADLHNVLRSDYLRMRFNIDFYKVAHIDKHRVGKYLLTSKNKKKLTQLPTSFENYSEVLAKLGYPVKLDFTSIFPKEGGNLRLLSDKIGEKKAFQQWIGIAPFSAHKGKTYPLELMEKVVAIIVSRHPSCRIFFFGGGREEMEILDNMASKSHNCVNASGLLSGMRDELILMSHLDVMVSMDSANMHMASLVNCPVVSIWGATHPYAGFVGWGQKDENFVQLDMPCRPCSIYGSKPCMRGDYACLSGIAPESIADKVESLL